MGGEPGIEASVVNHDGVLTLVENWGPIWELFMLATTTYRWISLYLFTMATGGHYITMLLADCIT